MQTRLISYWIIIYENIQKKCKETLLYNIVELRKKESDGNCSTTIHNKDISLKKKNTNSITVYIFGPRESGKTSFVINFCERKYENYYIPNMKTVNLNFIFFYLCVYNLIF